MTLLDNPPDDLTTVFVSYSRTDQKRALPVINLLRDAGYAVWWDGMLEAGERYLETTENALETARAVVVLWSETSVNSDWVRDEAMSGRDRKCLVPVSLDGTVPPLGFRQIQVIDLSNWTQKADSPRSAEILRTVAALHGREMPDRLPPRSAATGLVSRRGLILGAGVVTAGLAGGGYLLSRGGPEVRPAPLTGSGIVVMPFDNLSGDQENSILASALDTEIRKILSRNPALKVVARTSSLAVKNQGLTSEDLTAELGVTFLLEGSLIVTDGQLRISTSLIEGASGLLRWSNEYQGPPEDILKFQSDIARSVTANVTNEISQTDRTKRYGDTINALAFQEFLRGRTLFRDSETEADLVRAVDHFNRAIEIDPEFAAAHAIKARLYTHQASLSADIEAANALRAKAIISAETAIDLAPDSDDAFSTLGYINFFAQLDIAAAKSPYERSRALGLGNAVVLTRYATFAACNGNDAEALSAINRATELDPLNPTIFGRKGFIHYLAGRYQDAVTFYTRAYDLRATNFYRPSEIGLALFYGGDAEAALASCRTEESLMERFPCEAIALGSLGLRAEADAARAALIAEYGDAGLYQQAQILAQWGELEACQNELERAYELRDTGLTMVKMDPAMAPMRARPQFQALLARMGFQV